jgi:GH35 family endo-1,4-beta-xylanase
MSAKDKWERFPEYRRPAPDPVVEFLLSNGLSVHGHPMIYPPYHPAWTTNGADKAMLATCFERRIRQLGEHYGTRISQWDVVNETVDRSCAPCGPFHDKVCWRNPSIIVPDDYTFRCHEWAKSAFPPSVKLEMNDSWRPIYVPFIRSLIDRGVKIDIIGIQMHIFSADDIRMIAAGKPCVTNGTRWDPCSQMEMLRELDTLGRPVHISEVTIPAPDNSPEGEEIQARIVRDCYRLWFSWPSVYRITFWNLVDYTFHKENLASGLYAPDMRKKPAYHVLDQLINHEWRTSIEVHAKGGKVAFRGFRGRYRLTWMESEGRRKEKFIDLQ